MTWELLNYFPIFILFFLIGNRVKIKTWSKTTPVKALGSYLPTLNSVYPPEHGTHATSEAFIIHTNVSLLKGFEWTVHVPGGISHDEDCWHVTVVCPLINHLKVLGLVWPLL